MNMYNCSAKYRDACESGKVIYASFYRTLLMMNKIQVRNIDIKHIMQSKSVFKYSLYGCNDVTELFLELCKKYGCIPDIIIDTNPGKYRGKYSGYAVHNIDFLRQNHYFDLLIVMSNYNFNEVAVQLHGFGIEYARIISIEEFLAILLCEEV